MKTLIKISAKQLVGMQIKKYRDVTGLTQIEYANFIETTDTYLGKVERGEVNIGADNMQVYAESFGVMFYELANPNHPIPTLEEMPESLQKYVSKVKLNREARKLEPGLKITAYLDPVLDSNFLQTPQTARMIADEIERLYKITIPPGRITAELTKAPRNEKVKIVDRPVSRTEPGNWYQLISI